MSICMNKLISTLNVLNSFDSCITVIFGLLVIREAAQVFDRAPNIARGTQVESALRVRCQAAEFHWLADTTLLTLNLIACLDPGILQLAQLV